MRTKFINTLFRWSLRVIVSAMVVVLLAFVAIYIPAVQDFVLEKALTSVNDGPSGHISVGKFRLSPPLHFKASGVTVRQQGDTLAHVDDFALKISLLPLFKGCVGIDELTLDGVRFNIGNSDSLMCMKSDINHVRLADATVGLYSKEVDVDLFTIDGTLFSLDMRPDTVDVADTVKVSEPLPWKIKIGQLRIDSLTYCMTMQPTIDSLRATIPAALIDNTTVDLSGQAVDVRSLIVEGLTARYLTPATTGSVSSDSPDVSKPVDSADPWTIKVVHIDLKADNALYGVSGAIPQPGLDMNYLQLSRINIVVDSLMSRGSELRVPIRHISARERCGIDIMVAGLFAMDADSLSVTGMHLSTLQSAIDIDAMIGMGGSGIPMPLRVNGTGFLSPVDASLAVPSLSPMIAGIPDTSLIDLKIDIAGDSGTYDVNALSFEMPRCFDLSANGRITGLSDVQSMDGHLKLSGHVANGRWVRPALVAAKLDKTVAVPPLNLSGAVDFKRGTVTGNLYAATTGGKLALDASWTAKAEMYDMQLKTVDFPVDAFMPLLGVERVTAGVYVKGHGYNPFKPSTGIDANVHIIDIIYNKHRYADIELTARVSEGNADIAAISGNSAAAFDLRASGNLATAPYEWTMNADIANLDLQAMGMTDSVMYGSVSLSGNAVVNAAGIDGGITADLNVSDLDWHIGSNHIATTDMNMQFLTNDTLTSVSVNNHDLAMSMTSPSSLDSIMAHLDMTTAVIDTIMSTHSIKVEMIQRALPPFLLDLTAGGNNIVNNYLKSSGMGLAHLDFEASNDSLLDMSARIMRFSSGTTVLDTITAAVNQLGDTLSYRVHIGNRPGTLDQWAMVTARGRASDNRASILFDQQNVDGRTGYRLGFIARWLPDEIKVRVVPSHPVIGYKNWTVNDSNFVTFNTVLKHLDADLKMNSSESSIHLYTDHDRHNDSLQEDLILDVKNIKLAEWIALNPFAPPISGDLSADMRFGWDKRSVNGNGLISLTDLNYNRQRVGSFDLDVALMTNKSGTVRAAATLMVDSIRTITAEGNLNDSTARNPFLLDFKMIHFPLNVLNPFLPKDMARFAGTLNGTMDITGSLSEPVFNGYLDFDSTTLTVPMFGTSYSFSPEKIPMDSNIVTFNNYTIKGANANPLSISGTVDARHISDILIDLQARARDMQIVNSKKKRGVQVYGKAFIDLDASVKGAMTRLDIDADLSVLENTNVTYIVESATDNLTSRSNADMVRFVNFADTAVVAHTDSVIPSSVMMSIDAVLNVRQGSTIGVDLSTDGKNRVQLLSQGTLNYNISYMGDSRLTGRLNLNGGFVRYTPPFMSEKLFDFQEGSYISFNGDMMNPYLNVRAIDILRANVQQDGQNSRLINFDVILSVTNSLDNMNVSFDLSTNDDITVANELQSMSAEQRANQAMNLLLYNVYTGPGTKASSSLNGNPLFSFLESQVNSWAANNIKGVDLSFGIDQYDRTVNGASSTTTSYSYKVSKSLFNDRFKISIGGNYASDADRDQNLSQNLINDISFEYDITPSGSMYIKIFRHTGYESILEGEVTQTGLGFVYKRKLRQLSDLFRPFYRRPKTVAAPVADKKTDVQTNGTRQ